MVTPIILKKNHVTPIMGFSIRQNASSHISNYEIIDTYDFQSKKTTDYRWINVLKTFNPFSRIIDTPASQHAHSLNSNLSTKIKDTFFIFFGGMLSTHHNNYFQSYAHVGLFDWATLFIPLVILIISGLFAFVLGETTIEKPWTIPLFIVPILIFVALIVISLIERFIFSAFATLAAMPVVFATHLFTLWKKSQLLHCRAEHLTNEKGKKLGEVLFEHRVSINNFKSQLVFDKKSGEPIKLHFNYINDNFSVNNPPSNFEVVLSQQDIKNIEALITLNAANIGKELDDICSGYANTFKQRLRHGFVNDQAQVKFEDDSDNNGDPDQGPATVLS